MALPDSVNDRWARRLVTTEFQPGTDEARLVGGHPAGFVRMAAFENPCGPHTMFTQLPSRASATPGFQDGSFATSDDDNTGLWKPIDAPAKPATSRSGFELSSSVSASSMATLALDRSCASAAGSSIGSSLESSSAIRTPFTMSCGAIPPHF